MQDWSTHGILADSKRAVKMQDSEQAALLRHCNRGYREQYGRCRAGLCLYDNGVLDTHGRVIDVIEEGE